MLLRWQVVLLLIKLPAGSMRNCSVEFSLEPLHLHRAGDCGGEARQVAGQRAKAAEGERALDAAGITDLQPTT
jgi:hypothetical protein